MKYIIDMSDEYVMESALYGKQLAIPFYVNANDKSFFLLTGLKLTPYTEPDEDEIRQKDELRVGDEVKENTGLWTGVVVGFDKFDDLVIMDSSGNSCCGYKTKYFRKTGRHFDEVEALLKKMRGEQE